MFHDILFPTAISRGSQGGPERKTDVVVLGSGREERNTRWADSRRSYNAGYGIKTLDELHVVLTFFEERRGRLHSFRWRDHADHKSCAPSRQPAALDQSIGTGDGTSVRFQLGKWYGVAHAPYFRPITKPVPGTVLVAVDGIAKAPSAFTADPANGLVIFAAGHTPPAGASITAGFLFDVPVRFDTDKLEINLSGFEHGAIPSIPIVEVRA